MSPMVAPRCSSIVSIIGSNLSSSLVMRITSAVKLTRTLAQIFCKRLISSQHEFHRRILKQCPDMGRKMTGIDIEMTFIVTVERRKTDQGRRLLPQATPL